jgi:2-oxoglutarate ferredoxin oxidoreductase subunit alpha
MKDKKCVIVPELNLGQLLLDIQRINCGITKVSGLNKVSGEMLTPGEIEAKIKEEL